MKKHLLKLLLICCIGMLAVSLFACVPTTEQYKVNFIVEGQVYDSITTSGNSRVVLPSEPKITDRVFKGWFFDDGKWTEEFDAHSFEKNPINSDINIYARLELDKNHVCNKQWKTELQATCMSEGKRVQRCTDTKCGKVYAIESIPVSDEHTGKDEMVIVAGTPASCVAEGTYIEMYYCSLCGAKTKEEVKTSPVDSEAHSLKEQSKLVKAGDSFNFEAKCEYCADAFTIEDVDAAENIIEAATCDKEGKKNYKYSYAGLDFYTVEEIIPETGHFLCGIAIDESQTYSEMTHSNLFSKITWIADDNFENSTCGDAIEGIFTCEACSTSVKINAYKPHTGDWVKTADATCYKPGEEVLDRCSVCKNTDLKRQILATGDHKDGEIILVKDGTKFHLAIACENRNNKNPLEGCPHYDIMVRNVDITKQEEIISSDCQVPDVIRYTCKTPNGTYTYDEVVRTGHFVNGVRAETLTDENGWFNYYYLGKGISLFADSELKCGSQTNGMYTCESCKQVVLAVINRPHTGEWKVTTAPTCTSIGIENFYCDNCDYGHAGEVARNIDPIDHKYNYVLSIDENNKFYLQGKCDFCKTADSGRIPVTVAFSSMKNPTCKEKGEIKYTCYYDGGAYTKTVEIPVISHSLGNELIAKGERLDYAEYVETGLVDMKPEFIWCVSSAEDTKNDVDGTYKCTECGETVNIKIYRVHRGETTKTYTQNGTSPCETTVTEVFDCGYEACTYTSIKTYDEAKHNYVISIKSEDNGTYTVTEKCNVVGCPSVKVYTGITDVAQKILVQPTCSSMGSVEYKFTHNGEEITIIASVDRGNHILNGVDYETLYVDGKLPDNIKYVEVGTEKYFECEECGHLVNAARP